MAKDVQRLPSAAARGGREAPNTRSPGGSTRNVDAVLHIQVTPTVWRNWQQRDWTSEWRSRHRLANSVRKRAYKIADRLWHGPLGPLIRESGLRNEIVYYVELLLAWGALASWSQEHPPVPLKALRKLTIRRAYLSSTCRDLSSYLRSLTELPFIRPMDMDAHFWTDKLHPLHVALLKDAKRLGLPRECLVDLGVPRIVALDPSFFCVQPFSECSQCENLCTTYCLECDSDVEDFHHHCHEHDPQTDMPRREE
jgi:hypothetical protein